MMIQEKYKKLVEDAIVIASDHLLGKADLDLLIIKKEINILNKNNKKKVKPYFRDIIGTMKKILIFKKQDQIHQLIQDTFTVSVFPMLTNARKAWGYEPDRPK